MRESFKPPTAVPQSFCRNGIVNARTRSRWLAYNARASGVPLMKRSALASTFLVVLPAIGLGQTATIERQVTAKPDTNSIAGIFTEIQEDCTAGPLPTLRLLTQPAHGNVTMTQGNLHASKKCAGMDVP